MDNNISLLGYSWIVIRLGTFFSGIIAKRISKSNKHTMSLSISVSISAIALLILSLTGNWIIGSIAFSIHAMSWVVFSTVSNGLLYRHIPSNSRATILSGISMFNTIAGVIGLTVYAIIADNKLEHAFFLASFSMFMLFLLTSIRKRKV